MAAFRWLCMGNTGLVVAYGVVEGLSGVNAYGTESPLCPTGTNIELQFEREVSTTYITRSPLAARPDGLLILRLYWLFEGCNGCIKTR